MPLSLGITIMWLVSGLIYSYSYAACGLACVSNNMWPDNHPCGTVFLHAVFMGRLGGAIQVCA